MSKAVEDLRSAICKSFCADLTVNLVPSGMAVSTFLTDGSGDRISFYVVEDGESLRLEDDGNYLPHLIASGIDIEKGQRRIFLDGVLETANSYWDQDTFEIKSWSFDKRNLPRASLDFVSALLRIRDLELLTRDFIRSTFKEDAVLAIHERFDDVADVEENAPLTPEYRDIPADVVIRPKFGGRDTAVFFANGPVPFQEAELLFAELERDRRVEDFGVVALIEDFQKIDMIGRRRFQRAVNRGLGTPIFRDDETNAVDAIKRIIRRAA